MNILFLHPNFPAQFKHTCKFFALSGHDVRFLCQTHYNRTVPGVKRLCLKKQLGHDYLINNHKSHGSKDQLMAQQYLEGMRAIHNGSWKPDIVISHSGWGCGLYTKLVWRDCIHISFVEWWFDIHGPMFNYDPKNKYLATYHKKPEIFYNRNQNISLELSASDLIIAPTEWQKSQLPKIYKDRTLVVHDGINFQYYYEASNKKSRSNSPLITYGTRGMEPIRCFKEFIEELPYLLKRFENLHVQIAGVDEINYGGRKPSKSESWGKYAKRFLTEEGVIDKVHFVGRLPQDKYRDWLHSSWMHVYLTQPFVASWSLLESMAAQCFIVANSVPPVEEFCNVRNSWLVDSRKKGFLEEPAETLMASDPVLDTLRVAAGKTARHYSHQETNEKWRRVLAAHSSIGIDREALFS